MDGDCPSKHACIDQRCQNPCIVRNPCSGAQTCVVTDSLPIRTVGCVCPDGSVSGTSGECVKGKNLIERSIHENRISRDTILKNYETTTLYIF